MPRLSQEKKDTIIQALHDGKSMKWICDNLHHCSETVSRICANIYPERLRKKYTIRSDDSDLEGEVLGIFAGDGSFSHDG
jgi:hypothetical protein